MDMLRVRLSRLGYLSGHLGGVSSEYGLKHAENSSHSIVLRWIGQMPAGRVLDLGCSSGLLSERVRALGHRVTGVDVSALPGVTDRVDRFLIADLDRGLPPEVGEEAPFDLVIAADVLEHVRDPARLLRQIAGVLVPRGTLIASVPNFGHWYPRIRTAVGLFDYDQRGILDRDHVRFFSRRSLLDLLRRSDFLVTRVEATGLPLEVISSRDDALRRGMRRADSAAVGAWPTLFGYQFVVRCETPATISSSPSAAAVVARAAVDS
jgi:SAM-dependent methyltransferase